MQETRDPTIKLFGQAIPLPGDSDRQSPPPFHIHKQEQQGAAAVDHDYHHHEDEQPQQQDKHQTHEDPGSENGTEREQEADLPPKTPTIEEEEEEETPKSKDENSEKEQSQDKTLKKPDKLLPCPRCNSMDTKFCYYNNYNVNQPRYFCKACQRYWTAGGTMRNVPVGAGRRKNKNSTSHYRHISISEALQAARIDAPNGAHIPTLKSNGRVLSFGLDPPICDSMSSVLNIGENKVVNGLEDQIQNQRFPVSCSSVENGDDNSSANSMGEGSKSKINFPKQQQVVQNNGFIPQLPCIPSVPWPYTWNTPVPVPVPVPPPAMCPSGFPLPIYPAFWNCGVPGNWNVPWFPSASNSTPKSPSTGPNSPTLGKHSRDGEVITQDPLKTEEQSKQRNGCVLVPKTLRIDDPNEAAKSSIWATLGIKNESASGRRGMFNKSFQSTKGESNQVEASSFLMANPAALSRSLNFHENS